MQSCKLFGTSRLAGGFLFIQKKEPLGSLLYHLPEKFFFIYFKYFLFYELNMTR